MLRTALETLTHLNLNNLTRKCLINQFPYSNRNSTVRQKILIFKVLTLLAITVFKQYLNP